MDRFGRLFFIGCLVGLLLGCEAPPAAAPTTPPPVAQSGANPGAIPGGDSSGGSAASPASPETPMVLVGNDPVRLADLRTALVEANGATVLADLLLDRMIARRLAEAGLRVTDADIDQERALFTESLSQDADQAARLLNDIRRRRGLGPTRFRQMLYRSAALRKVVQTDVTVTPAAIDQAYQLEYGQRYECRLIVVPTLRDAGRVLQQARTGGGGSFIDLAIKYSTDSSRAQGGLLPTISTADPTFPQSVRTALKNMTPDQISDPINLDNGFAILKLERVIPAQTVALDTVRADLERRVRRNVERMLMDQEARAMVKKAEASMVILDPELKRAWDAQAEGGR